MKNKLKYRYLFITFLSTILFVNNFHDLRAQNSKKHKVRLSVNYTKIVDGEIYVDVRATAKIGKKNIRVANIEVSSYNELEDNMVKLGSNTTNANGDCRFVFSGLSTLKPDSTNNYTISAFFSGNDTLKKASKKINFRNAHIEANLITKDSINYITATLTDRITDEPIIDESLDVQIQRLFMPLKIGEEFNYTDEKGNILVQVEDGIPGLDGNLTFEIVLNENDDYGTVIALVEAPIGTPIVDESTFDQRTMWSPRNKTPLFLLFLPNILILGMWVLILYLCINMVKIAKL